MPEGVIRRLHEVYGLVESTEGVELKFLCTGLARGVSVDDLAPGMRVIFEVAASRTRPGEVRAVGLAPHPSVIAAAPKPAEPSPTVEVPAPAAAPAPAASSEPVRAAALDGRAQLAAPAHLVVSSAAVGAPVLPAAIMGGLPYHFAAIEGARAVTDTPVWHDGSSGGDLLSGEILCTLDALTPLLPGNPRYLFNDADPARLKTSGMDANKQVAEPLRLRDGRVVAAGTALKGMLKHSLAALLSAPMERVAEHHYTYRPNLDLNSASTNEQYVVRPARVVSSRSDGSWDIEVFANAQDALFVRKNAEPAIRAAAGSRGTIDGRAEGVDREVQQRGNRTVTTNRIIRADRSGMTLSHRLANYKGGIDGAGFLAAAFNRNPASRETANGNVVNGYRNGAPYQRGPFTYDLALVPIKPYLTLRISASLYETYMKQQQNVLANNQTGHLTAHPLDFKVDQVAKNIRTHAAFDPGQLIYVELTTDANGNVTNDSEVVSCGHHFRYRWAYTSSVRKHGGKTRTCLQPLGSERLPSERAKDANVAPERLSGVRLLFGYVRDEDSAPIGKGVHERLAGRIAINHAVSVGVPTFLGSKDQGYCVPLAVLGKPRPSACEFYLRQDPNQAPATYGDLPHDAGGELAGRKFYRHQPWVKTVDQIRAADADAERSDQGTLARFICAPETRFRFAVRFARLRSWELGALLSVLQPHHLTTQGEPGGFAHKLGLGRPLGMGSVRITPVVVRLRPEKKVRWETEWHHDDAEMPPVLTQSLLDFKSKLNGAGMHVADWLRLHEFDPRATGRLAYPRARTRIRGVEAETIYAFHTDVRREYSKLRRKRNANWAALRDRISAAMLKRAGPEAPAAGR